MCRIHAYGRFVISGVNPSHEEAYFYIFHSVEDLFAAAHAEGNFHEQSGKVEASFKVRHM